MLFNSYIFILAFLPLVLTAYYISKRWCGYSASLAVIIIGSFVFYAYDNPGLLLVLLSSIVMNWFFSRILQREDLRGKPGLRKGVLFLGCFLDLGVIFYFKYLLFTLRTISFIFGTEPAHKNILLPLGISFYTFQQISYLIDSYRNETENYRFLEYVSFIAFFPQLVAGPIVFHDEMIPQFRSAADRGFDRERFSEGIYDFSIGIAKKVLIADLFGRVVAFGWSTLETAYGSWDVIILMFSFTFQLYFDFSGYCDMAIGIGKMFGMDLPINFNSPLKASSVTDFWRRWHITLTRFLRKYVYYPLGGGKKGEARTYRNIMLVFLLSGIWHGANWTYILWGLMHGLGRCFDKAFGRLEERIPRWLSWCVTYLFVNAAFLVFRADSVVQALKMFKRVLMLVPGEQTGDLIRSFQSESIGKIFAMAGPGISGEWLSLGWMLTVFLAALLICLLGSNLYEKYFKPTAGKAVFSAVLLCWSIVSLEELSPFLYFNF